MGQEHEPRFSYITVGGASADGDPQPDDEEVITIGAVDVEPSRTQAATTEAARLTRPGDAQDGAGQQPGTAPSSEWRQPEQTAEDADLDVPMPTIQKVVIVACLIGLVVTIAFLVWYWVIQP